jgi:hypothetical protein
MSGNAHGGHTVSRNYMLSERMGDAEKILAVSAIAHGSQPISLSTTPYQRTAVDIQQPLAETRAVYLKQPLVDSTLSTIGEWHPDKRDAVNEARTIHVSYSSLELGYIGNYARNRDALLAANRKFKEAVGDYKIAR